jgi:hypothetical protein
MSVENFDHLEGALAFLDGDAPENCFFCGKPLAGLTAYWHGQGRGVALHPDCAVSLGARLCRDGLNAKLIAEGKPVTAGIGLGLVGQK